MSDEAGRIAELEAELAHVKRERDMLKSTVYDRLWDAELDRPMTAEDADKLMNGPRGPSIDEILAEFEKGRGRTRS